MYIKDLKIFKNRNIKDMIIIDNSLIALYPNINNGILIKSYYGDKNDQEFKNLLPFLLEIKDCPNVWDQLSHKFSLNKMINLAKFKKY